MKILVVEDESNIQHILKYNLELDGHTVDLASTGAEAMTKLNPLPDLILMDVMMPEMNGLEACLKIKSDPSTRQIPVFMITAKSQLGDIEEAFKVGADDYLTKPFDPTTLSARIEEKLERYKQSLES
jgi:DNA-binding response OmpR family regulator